MKFRLVSACRSDRFRNRSQNLKWDHLTTPGRAVTVECTCWCGSPIPSDTLDGSPTLFNCDERISPPMNSTFSRTPCHRRGSVRQVFFEGWDLAFRWIHVGISVHNRSITHEWRLVGDRRSLTREVNNSSAATVVTGHRSTR